jgi:hypothetical protein
VSQVYLISCKKKSNTPSIVDRVESSSIKSQLSYSELTDDFKEFYLHFHSDSIFQMSCIFFPLEGLPDNADPGFIGNEKYFWSPDQWVVQKELPNDDNKFSREYTTINDILIEETITDKELDLKLIRRFAKTGGGWRLIYYAGMNKYSIK